MVFYDYFRADDRESALEVALLPGGPLGPDGMARGVDGLALKGMDSKVVMGRLLAFVLDVAWTVDVVESVMIWPDTPQPRYDKGEYGGGGDVDLEESPWATGPWVEEFGAAFRDAIAAVDDGRLPEISARWAGIEEFRPWPGDSPPDWALDVVTSFVALARRAREAGDGLYCWACL